MKDPKPARPYRGPLAEPWVDFLSEAYASPEHTRQELQERLTLLFEHYEIDAKSDEAWRDLALALAVVHVPGFRHADEPPPQPGRPKRWNFEQLYRLMCDVEALLNRQVSVEDVCAKLSRTSPYRELAGAAKGESVRAETLRRRYYEAKETIGAVLAEIDT